MTSTEIATVQQTRFTDVLADGYSSIKGNDREARRRIFAAIANAEDLSNHIDEPIRVVDIIVEPARTEDKIDETTGEVTEFGEEYLRTTLIDDEGIAYTAGSKGLANSVRNVLRILGEPSTWTEPETLKVVKRPGSRKGWEFFSLIPA